MVPISGRTRVFALLGDPVSHSLSPRVQNAALAAAGVDGVFVAIRCGSHDCRALIRALARSGGGGNVTLPHKELAAGVVDSPSDRVLRTGACNTFWLEGSRVHGENTDVEGFRTAAHTLLGRSPRGGRVLLLGAGGAARAAVAALQDDGASVIHILNRSRDRAEALAAEQRDGPVQVLGGPDEVRGERFDLVVNATSVGLAAGDEPPVNLAELDGAGAVLDMVYGPGDTALVREARRLGVPAADGTEMLLQQAAAAFRLWWRQDAPIAAMRAALEAGP